VSYAYRTFFAKLLIAQLSNPFERAAFDIVGKNLSCIVFSFDFDHIGSFIECLAVSAALIIIMFIIFALIIFIYFMLNLIYNSFIIRLPCGLAG